MSKTILLTGATGAIGSATAYELAKTGSTVILLSRNKAKLDALKKDIVAKTGNNNIDIIVADFTHISSIRNAAKEIKQKYNHLDVLINMAAIYRATRELSKDNLEMTFAVNHLAPFVLTHELLPLLKAGKPSRIINVSAPSFTKLKFDDLQGEKKYSALNSFGGSKMMNMMFTYSLARRVENDGVSVSVFHPGAVKTELTNDMPWALRMIFKMLRTGPEKAAAMLAKLSVDPAYEKINGKFYKFDGKEIKSNAYSYDKELQEKLWQISEQMI